MDTSWTEVTSCYLTEFPCFLLDLINDWAVAEPADIAYFVPYEWEFKFYFRDYEMIWLVNEHNWIDCTNESENGKYTLSLLF